MFGGISYDKSFLLKTSLLDPIGSQCIVEILCVRLCGTISCDSNMTHFIRSDRISVHRRNPLCVCVWEHFSCLQYDPSYSKSPRSNQINPSEPK